MEQLAAFFQNRILQAAFCAWFAAQGMKVLLDLLINKQFKITRLFFGLGGMPSSHAASLCAVSVAIGFQQGFSSALFGLAACVTMVVMIDAAGVRRAAGKQAAVLNRIIDDMIQGGKGIDEEKLKELIGHTPVQVVAGALLGIIVGIIMG